MVDKFNNETGALKPDGIPDDQATTQIKAVAAENQEKADAQARAVALGNDPDTVSEDPLDALIARLPVLDAQNAANKKDDSYRVSLSRGPVTSQGVGGISYGPDRSPATYRPMQGTAGVDTLLSEGFLGVSDQGIIDAVATLSKGDTEKYDPIYKSAVAEAAYKSKAGTLTTVSDVLARWAKSGLPKNLRSGGSGGGGAFSSTNRVVSLSDEGTARLLLNNSLSRYLGREATKEENEMFLKALNVQEKQNPTVTVSKGYTDGSGNTTQRQNVSGGMNKEDFATRFARSQEGYAEYQTATTYLDSFIKALESDSRVI